MHHLFVEPPFQIPLLKGKDDWITCSTGLVIYIRGKGNHEFLTENPPINPGALKDGLSSDQVRAWIMVEENLEFEQINPQNLSSNKQKATTDLQETYNEWKKRDKTTFFDIFYHCSEDIQTLNRKYNSAKDAWEILSKFYRRSDMATFRSELHKLESLCPGNMKDVQHSATLIFRSKAILADMGQILPDAYYVHILLKALGASYASLAREIERRDISTIKLDDCVAQAFAEETIVMLNDTMRLQPRR